MNLARAGFVPVVETRFALSERGKYRVSLPGFVLVLCRITMKE